MGRIKRLVSMLCLFALMFSMFSMTGIQSEYQQQVEAYGGRSVIYDAHISMVGWVNNTTEPNKAGQEGGNSIEAVRLRLNNYAGGAQIEYQAHVAYIGWQNSVTNGAIAGTTGLGRHMEAIRIKLNNMAGWSVYYRVYMNGKGWGPFVRNNEVAGTTGENRPIEAIQVLVVRDDRYTARIFYDSTALNELGVPGIQAHYQYAAAAITRTYGIRFTITSSDITQSTALNGSNCPFFNQVICISLFCGTNSNCNGNHHKGAVRLINTLPSSNSFYTMGVVSHALCVYRDPDHFAVGGAAPRNGRQSLVTNEWEQDPVPYLMQHELSHNLGAFDCSEDRCVMGPTNRGMDTWCLPCSNDIWDNRI
ncbi:MAG: hypothetical protein FWG83_05630 [Oscillospiraceae bacterium]|nr:hypothetical protein [Oscillospiraceae bacterium]